MSTLPVLLLPLLSAGLLMCDGALSPVRNVVDQGTASQSSTIYSPLNAIDGNPNSYSHTGMDVYPWWVVDLKEPFLVTSVTLAGHTTCCQENTNGAEIRIGNSMKNNTLSNPSCGFVAVLPPGHTQIFDCGGMEGRYVSVSLPGRRSYLWISEVGVFAFSPQTTNLALYGIATQSSHSETAFRVIAGNISNASCSLTSFEPSPWWRVDLGDSYPVSSVVVTNRGDCCPEKINGSEIRIGNSPVNGSVSNPRCTVIESLRAWQTEAYDCGGMVGRYVTIVTPGRSETLGLCGVQVLAVDTPAVNVAYRGLATQSSYLSAASQAIDGNPSSYSQTNYDFSSWWTVDLKDVYVVSSVALTHVTCCPERIVGAEIRIGNNMTLKGISNPRCGVVTVLPSGNTKTFNCSGMVGRYVTVVIPGRNEYLSVSELQIFSYSPSLLNVALQGIATQSSTAHPASNAIDDDMTPDSAHGSCSSTNYTYSPWWMVDLRMAYRVSSVVVTSRGDCCPDGLKSAVITIGNSSGNGGASNPRCVSTNSLRPGEIRSFDCGWMAAGRYVSVLIPGQYATLTLCEVQVFAIGPRQIQGLRVMSSAEGGILHNPENRQTFLNEIQRLIERWPAAMKNVSLTWVKHCKRESHLEGLVQDKTESCLEV